jgi:asparagine synthase (glutamine-hydrolysing)
MPYGMRGRNFLQHISLAGAERYLDSGTFFRRDDMKGLLQPAVYESLAQYEPWRAKAEYLESSDRHWLSSLQGLDMKNYLPLDILTKVDRMSMAHSIETRVPLLDHKLIEFAATIPPEMNLRWGTTKYVLKRAMRGILPDSIIDRPKRGFAVPLGYWFRGQLGAYVRDLLLGDSSRRRGFFNGRYIENLVARHERGENLDLQLWTLISFELWSRAYLDRGAGRETFAAA